jgi:dimethylargininase
MCLGSLVDFFHSATSFQLMALTAITREVSANINDCELSFHSRALIDVRKAMAQHAAYRDCLTELGARVIALPAEPRLADAVFVEDTAVVFDEIAVISRMGATSRRPETTSVAAALAQYRPLKYLAEPATLDGGDVLRVDRTVFVGLSRRTNSEAVAQLREWLEGYNYRLQAVEVRGCLHLKSACSDVGKGAILANQSWIDVEQLRGFELLQVPAEEPAAANALLLNGVVVLPASFPRTRALLEQRGFCVRPIDVSELQKAEAGVTCCSLVFNSRTIAPPQLPTGENSAKI